MECGAKDSAEAEARGISAGEVSARETFWKNLVLHFGENATLDAITKASIIGYEGARRAKVSGQTIRKEVAALKRAFERALEDGIDVRPPVRWPKIKSDPPDEARQGKLVTGDVLNDWLAELPSHLRDEFRFCYLTNLREGEIHRVEHAWMAKRGRSWFLEVPAAGAKNRKARRIPLDPEAREILLRYPSGSPVFARERWQGRYWMRKAARIVGLTGNGVTLRDLRTTWATDALAATGDAAAVQAAMGHSDLKTTQLYQRTTLQRATALGASLRRTRARRQKGNRS